MRLRARHAWAFGGFVAVALLLSILFCQPGIPAAPPAGMSAPAAPQFSIESAHLAKLVQSAFDWHGHAAVSGGLSLTLTAHPAQASAGHLACASPPQYGPLHNRPPPSFS